MTILEQFVNDVKEIIERIEQLQKCEGCNEDEKRLIEAHREYLTYTAEESLRSYLEETRRRLEYIYCCVLRYMLQKKLDEMCNQADLGFIFTVEEAVGVEEVDYGAIAENYGKDVVERAIQTLEMYKQRYKNLLERYLPCAKKFGDELMYNDMCDPD